MKTPLHAGTWLRFSLFLWFGAPSARRKEPGTGGGCRNCPIASPIWQSYQEQVFTKLRVPTNSLLGLAAGSRILCAIAGMDEDTAGFAAGSGRIGCRLGQLFSIWQTLTSEMAYEIASRNEDARRSVVVSRVNQEFRELFAKRFTAEFSGGMSLNRSKRSARLSYRPASPTLLYGGTDKFAIQIPDVLGLSSQFKSLPKIWNACVEDLTGYSRAKFKTGGSCESLKAYSALPADLRAGAGTSPGGQMGANPEGSPCRQGLCIGRCGDCGPIDRY